MGCAASVEVDPESDPFLEDKRLNDVIEQRIKMTKQHENDEFKLLLLGAGESGKSTVLKQLKLLHKGGFTQQERAQYSQVIWCDAVQLMKTLILKARLMGILLQCDQDDSTLLEARQYVLRANPLDLVDTGTAGGDNFLNEYVLKYSDSSKQLRQLNLTGVVGDDYTSAFDMFESAPAAAVDGEDDVGHSLRLLKQRQRSQQGTKISRLELARAVHDLWTYDSGIRKCYARSNEFQLESLANYYFDNIMQFADETYLCSDTDILQGRIKTTGITETNFVIKNYKIKVLDAGGQRLERKKWIHCFDNITAVIFVLALSEYDQKLFEDERVNRMHELVVLFETLCNSKWFSNTPFILFLNKTDVFEKKLTHLPLRQYCPDYTGPPDNADEAIKFFEKNLLKMNRSNKPLYIHRTCATDTGSMRFVLSAVTDLIIQRNLKQSGIL